MVCFEQAKRATSHDPCRAGDRSPRGAVPAGTDVSVTLRVEEFARWAVGSAVALVGERVNGSSEFSWTEVPLWPCEVGYTSNLGLKCTPQVAFYVFRLDLTDGSSAYYVPRADGRGTIGELVADEVDGCWTERGWAFSEERLEERPSEGFCLMEMSPGFQVTVYNGDFKAPNWMSGAVMYQIFPDRFARSSPTARPEGLEYHRKMNRTVRLHRDWDEPVAWQPLDETSDDPREAYFDPVDFFGGTLEGIRGKLDYLASLGVEVVYLNPVFEARSNHRYDTADYEHIDPLLGSDEDFKRLAEDAGKRGIRIVLDLVLSHTGNDSRYFNADRIYDQLGAAQGCDSPYYSWYDFENGSGDAPYRCWWGDPTLPEVNERDATWQHYVLGEGGIVERWLAAGAQGYRLDVADEIPDDVLERIRTCVKGANPDAAIIGEVWEDATTKESYGVPRTYALGSALDSVMNYPLRSALLGFAVGTLDAHQLMMLLLAQKSNYPPQMYERLMNLLSSHDVERLRSALVFGQPLRHMPREDQLELTSGTTAAQDVEAARLQKMIATLLFALPGMPCVYYGDECGLMGGGDPFCRATMPFSAFSRGKRPDCGVDLTAFYQSIGMLRKGSHALRRGSFACAAPNDDVICAIRVDREEGVAVIAAANRADKPLTVAFDASSAEVGLPAEDRAALKGATACAPMLFSASAEALPAARCEDGIICVAAPPCSAAYWRLPLGGEEQRSAALQ